MSFTFADEVSEQSQSKARRMTVYRAFGKRALDIVVVLMIAPIALPIILLSALIVGLRGGKGIYGQPRIGRDGRIFRCWKIRTMVPNANEALLRMLAKDPDLAREWQVNQKLEHDPRITPFGAILRKLSIDELPQLWNVLTGEMSLIGPRPFTPEQKVLYDGNDADKRSYYRERPGITGLWQVECRNEGGFRDRVVFDEKYSDQLSFWLDLKIALLTVAAIARGTGQ